MYHALESILHKNRKGVEKKLLIYDFTMTYLVGEKTIEQRLELLKDLGKVEEVDGVLLWKKEKTKN